MRDRELWRKEFHECWSLVAAVAGTFLLVGLVLVRLAASMEDLRSGGASLGVNLDRSYGIPSGLEEMALAAAGFSLLAGVLLALRQFLVPSLVGEWPFLLHREVTRARLLGVKVGMAALLLGGSLVVVWTVLLWIAGRSHVSLWPVAAGTWREGVLFLSWGGIAYLATADACLSRRPWYTTKCVAPLAVSLGALCCAALPTPLHVLWLTLAVAVLCGLSLSATFLTHEFEGGA